MPLWLQLFFLVVLAVGFYSVALALSGIAEALATVAVVTKTNAEREEKERETARRRAILARPDPPEEESPQDQRTVQLTVNS